MKLFNNLPLQTIAIESQKKVDKIKEAWLRVNPTGTEEEWKLYYEALDFWTDIK